MLARITRTGKERAMMRKILISLAALVVVIGVGFYALFSSLDGLIVTAVEKVGSQVTGVAVNLDKAAVSLSSGKGSLSGLRVNNPAGFETASAFRLATISVSLDAASVTSDPVTIKEIVISRPNVTYELGSSGSNIDAIQRNVDRFIAANKPVSGSGGASNGGGAGAEKGPKLIIENLYIRGGEINVSATFLGGKTMTTSLPDIHLKDIGKDTGGASPGEIASKVMEELSSGAGQAVGALNLDAISGAVGEGAKAVTETLGEGAKTVAETIGKGIGGATNVLKDGATGAGDVIEGVGGKLKGLFGK